MAPALVGMKVTGEAPINELPKEYLILENGGVEFRNDNFWLMLNI